MGPGQADECVSERLPRGHEVDVDRKDVARPRESFVKLIA